MATKVDLPKDIIRAALEQAGSLRTRNIKAATNTIIKEALEQELEKIRLALNSLETIQEKPIK